MLIRLSSSSASLFYLCLASSTRTSLSFTTSFALASHTTAAAAAASATAIVDHRGYSNTSNKKMNMSSSSSNAGLSDVGTTTTKSSNKNNNKNKNKNDDQSITLWRDRIEISMAKSRKVRGGNFVQIATVDPQTLEPRCRTVVFRGFLGKKNNHDDGVDDPYSDVMKMITDLRSSKVSEITNSSKDGSNNTSKVGEMVWWFSKSSEQYRIRGTISFVGKDHADTALLQKRKEQWGNLSDSAREQFYWKDPATDYEVQNEVPKGGREGGGGDGNGDGVGKVLPPPENFLLMLLTPTRVDYLRLGDNYRQIDELIVNGDDVEKNAGEWTCRRVNP